VRNTEADHAAAHLGKAIGIANLLRGTHAHSAQRRCYIPTAWSTVRLYTRHPALQTLNPQPLNPGPLKKCDTVYADP